MKIFVKPNFMQIEGDVILYQHDEIIALDVADESLYAEYRLSLDAEYVKNMEETMADLLTKELNLICDKKTGGVKAIIAKMPLSSEQMEEYAMVADAVEREDVDWFEDEALIVGSTAQVEFDKAKEAKENYSLAFNAFKKLIRVYRRGVAKEIENKNFKGVEQLLEKGKEIGAGVEGTPLEILQQSKEQVMNMFKEDDNGNS